MNEENKVLENEVEETLETETDVVYDENGNPIVVLPTPDKAEMGVAATTAIIAVGAIAFIGLKKGVGKIIDKVKKHRDEMREFKEWKEATSFDRFDEDGNVIDESEEKD